MNLKKLANNIDTLKADGLTWEEIRVELNKRYNVEYSESAYRKPYKAYKQGVKDSVTQDDIAHQMYELEKKKKQSSIERSIARADIRDTAIREKFYEDITNAVENLPNLPSVPSFDRKWVKTPENHYIVAMGDLHYKGDKEWLEEKMARVEEEVVNFMVKKGLKDITIIELGDTIDGGALRPSQLMALKLGMVDQAIEVSEYYARMLNNVQNKTGGFVNFGIVTSSNHTELRPLNTKRKELVEEDMMKVIAKYIELRLSDNSMINVFKDKHLRFQSGDNRFVAGHGDTGGMTPNTLIKHATELDSYYRYNADYFFFGHYHHYLETTMNSNKGKNRKAFLIPSLAGEVESYEERNLLGSEGGFSIFAFNKNGHQETKHVRV